MSAGLGQVLCVPCVSGFSLQLFLDYHLQLSYPVQGEAIKIQLNESGEYQIHNQENCDINPITAGVQT